MSSDLIDRYVKHVGRHLPKAERADVEDELQSLIEEQLADRHGATPTAAEITALLRELGEPWRIAASYNADRHLIGAELYPPTISVLRYGWLVVPVMTSFISVLSAAAAPPFDLAAVIVRTIAAVAILTAAFTGVVVVVAALIESALREGRLRAPSFDPAVLPAIDDPLAVERTELIFSVVFGAFWTLLFAHFLAVGGLTLRFDQLPPPDLIPVPRAWLGGGHRHRAGRQRTHGVGAAPRSLDAAAVGSADAARRVRIDRAVFCCHCAALRAFDAGSPGAGRSRLQ